MAQRSELAQLGEPEPRELLFPAIQRLLADAEGPANLGDFLAALDLVQGVDDLFVAEAFSGHGLRLLGRPWPACLGNHRSARFHLSAVPICGVWVSVKIPISPLQQRAEPAFMTHLLYARTLPV
jgi:hypothetical protein